MYREVQRYDRRDPTGLVVRLAQLVVYVSVVGVGLYLAVYH